MDNLESLRTAIRQSGQTCHERFGTLEVCTKSIAFLHGDDIRLLESTIAEGRWDLVCYGHSHVATTSRVGPTVVLNPGALHRTAHPSVAVVEMPALRVTVVPI